jgi:hypothetical protein
MLTLRGEMNSLNPQQAESDRGGGASRWLTAVWLGALLLLVFLVGCVEIEDPDIWWHLRTGQLIYQRGELPRSDWFTYTNPDAPWIDLHWGFQLIAAALWALGGAPALVLTKSVLAVTAFGAAMSAVRRSWPAWQTVACWLPAVLIFSGRNQVRPEMFSLLFLAAELAVLFHARAKPRLLWLLPPIQLLWINVHGLFVLGLVLWGCYLFGAIRLSSLNRATVGRWAVVSGLMLAATLANPYGLDGAMFPLTLLTRIEGPDRAFYAQFSGEFRGLSDFIRAFGFAALFDNLTTLMLMVLFVFGSLSFVPAIRRGRLDLYRLAIFVLFGWLAWKANRNAVLFALVGTVAARANLGEWLAERAGRPRRFDVGGVLTAAVLGLLGIGVPFDLLSVVRPAEIPRLFGVREIPGAFAHAAARFLGRDGMPRRCYALDEGAAAVYIFHNGPQRRVFADARLEVNTRETLERYLAIEWQLSQGDRRALDSLTQDIEPGADDQIELPALLISLRYLAARPQLQQGLMTLKRFRRVYVDDIAVVFIDQRQAEALGLPEVTE